MRIQANLSDLRDNEKSALSLSLIGPIGENSALTDVADLDGLVGKGRAELAYSWNVVDTTTTKVYASVTGAAPVFEFRNATDPTGKEESRKAIYGVKAGLAYTAQKYWALTIGARIEKAYKDRSKQTVCTPLSAGPAGTLTCEALVIGAPTLSEKRASDVALRVALASYVSLGVNWVHDFKNRVDGIEVPVWIIPDAGGSLGGGVRFGYLSRGDRKLSIGLFVGTFKL